MKRRYEVCMMLGVAVAALPSSVAFAGGAYSGQGTASKSQPALTSPAGSNSLLPGQIVTSSKIVGLPCYDRNGERVGSVEAVVVNAPASDVGAVVLGVRGFLHLDDKHVAVKMSDLAPSGDGFSVGYTKRQLQRTVDYRLSYDPPHR